MEIMDRGVNEKIISQKRSVDLSLAWANLFFPWRIPTFLQTTDYWLKGVASIRNLFLPLTLFLWREIIPPSNKKEDI